VAINVGNTKMNIPGMKLRYPFSRCVVSGLKSIDSRYTNGQWVQEDRRNVPVAVIETNARANPQIPKERGSPQQTIGVMYWTKMWTYQSEEQWKRDENFHRASNARFKKLVPITADLQGDTAFRNFQGHILIYDKMAK